jgi:putative aminopeptidase FrvX
LEELQSFRNRTTWEKQNQVANYLYNKLKPYKTLDVSYHFYTAEGKIWKNVVTRLSGKKDPETVYIVCAHYDSHPAGWESHRSAPGADDNGTGVAVLLEGARFLAGNPGNNTVEWIFFSNEEQGHKGSQAYAQELAAKGRSLKGVINIDTIGYTQPSLTALWRETQGKGFLRKGRYLAKQMIKKPIYFIQTGFKNPNEILLIGGRPANTSFIENIYSRLKGGDIGVKKNIGPQCG